MDDNEIIQKASRIASVFHAINTSYTQMHDCIAHSNPIAPEVIPNSQMKIDGYMSTFREHFPESVIPRHHFLEEHTLPWIIKYKLSMGLLVESGGEGVHAEF